MFEDSQKNEKVLFYGLIALFVVVSAILIIMAFSFSALYSGSDKGKSDSDNNERRSIIIYEINRADAPSSPDQRGMRLEEKSQPSEETLTAPEEASGLPEKARELLDKEPQDAGRQVGKQLRELGEKGKDFGKGIIEGLNLNNLWRG